MDGKQFNQPQYSYEQVPGMDYFHIASLIGNWNNYMSYFGSDSSLNTPWETSEIRSKFEKDCGDIKPFKSQDEYLRANGVIIPVSHVKVNSNQIKFPPSSGSKVMLGVLIPHMWVLPAMRNQTMHITIFGNGEPKHVYVQATTGSYPEFTGTFELGEIMKNSIGFTIDSNISGYSPIADPTLEF